MAGKSILPGGNLRMKSQHRSVGRSDLSGRNSSHGRTLCMQSWYIHCSFILNKCTDNFNIKSL